MCVCVCIYKGNKMYMKYIYEINMYMKRKNLRRTFQRRELASQYVPTGNTVSGELYKLKHSIFLYNGSLCLPWIRLCMDTRDNKDF